MPARSVILLMGIGDGKPDEAYRTLGAIHFLQQLLGQGEDDVERRQFLALRQAAGDLLEVSWNLIFKVRVLPRKSGWRPSRCTSSTAT